MATYSKTFAFVRRQKATAYRTRLKQHTLKQQHWLKALALAQTLFEDHGYNPVYLQEIATSIKGMYE